MSSNYGPTNDALFLTDNSNYSFLSNRKVKIEAFLFYLTKIPVSLTGLLQEGLNQEEPLNCTYTHHF